MLTVVPAFAGPKHLAPDERRLQALDETLLPRRAPLGWVTIVRPERYILVEGPIERAEQMFRQTLRRLEPATSSASHDVRLRRRSNSRGCRLRPPLRGTPETGPRH